MYPTPCSSTKDLFLPFLPQVELKGTHDWENIKYSDSSRHLERWVSFSLLMIVFITPERGDAIIRPNFTGP
jgi:hypothetical protein